MFYAVEYTKQPKSGSEELYTGIPQYLKDSRDPRDVDQENLLTTMSRSSHLFDLNRGPKRVYSCEENVIRHDEGHG